jgi:hypothetical protein
MNNALISVIEVDDALRRSKGESEAFIMAVNLIRNLFPYEVGLGFSYHHGYKAIAHSDIPSPDTKSPFIKNLVRFLGKKSSLQNPEIFSASEVSSEFVKQGIGFVMVIPIRRHIDGVLMGALLFGSSSGFSKEATVLASHCAETLSLVLGSINSTYHFHWKRWISYGVFIAALGSLFMIQVPISTLGNAQVVAKNPTIITAPMNGIVKSVHVKSNDSVKKGEILVSFDDIEIKGKQRVAAQTINVSSSEMIKQERASFFDPSIKNRLEESRAERAVKAMEYNAISAQLKKLTVFAPSGGIVILDNPDEMIGKPFKAGEKLLSIVEPTEVKVEILVGTHESNIIKRGDIAGIYLDNDPFHPFSGMVSDIYYEPMMAPSNVLSYKAHVTLDANQTLPTIGMCGKVKIKGENVSLFMYLMRKPMAYLRWYFG